MPGLLAELPESKLAQRANLAVGLVLMQHFPGPGTDCNSRLVKPRAASCNE